MQDKLRTKPTIMTWFKSVPHVCRILPKDLVTCISILLLIGWYMVFWYEDDSSYLIIIFVFYSINSLFNTLFILNMITLYNTWYVFIRSVGSIIGAVIGSIYNTWYVFIRSVGSIIGAVIGSIFGIIVLVVVVVVICSQIKSRGVRGTVINPINVSTVQHSSPQHQQRKSLSQISIFKIVLHLEYICMCKYAEQSRLTSNPWTWKKTMTCDVRNPDHGLGPAQNMAGLNRLIGSQPSPLNNGIWSVSRYMVLKFHIEWQDRSMCFLLINEFLKK